MLKTLLQALLLVVLLECVNAGVPNFYRRQGVPIADNEGDYIDSDDFLANFLENIPEILDEPEKRNSVQMTKKNPGDTVQYNENEPIHKHHDIDDVKKNLPYDNINQAPIIVPDSGTVSKKAPAELKARSDIVTGVSAVATVVSGAMAQFMSFLARKKLMIAAVGAAVLGTLGISHVVTDDLIGFAENITGVRLQRQFEESNEVSPMRQLIGDVVSWFSDSNISESVDSNNLIEERTDTVIFQPVNPRNSLTSNEDVLSNKDDIAALSSLISINSTNDDKKEIKFREVEVNKQAPDFGKLAQISSKSNVPADVDDGESKIVKSHKNFEVNVVSEVNDNKQFETSESTPSLHFSPLKEASDSTFKTNIIYEESQSVSSDNTVQSSDLSEERVIDDFFIEEDPFMVTVLSPEYSKFADMSKSQEDLLAPLSEVEYNSDSSRGNETVVVGHVESEDVDSSMHSLSRSFKFPTPLSQITAKSPSSTFENNTHIGDQGISQNESNLVNQGNKVSGFEKSDTDVKRLNISDELLDDDISMLGVDVEVIVDKKVSKDRNKTEVLDLIKIDDDKVDEVNIRMVEGKVAPSSESKKLNVESKIEAVSHHNTINDNLNKSVIIEKIEPLSIDDTMMPGVSASLSGVNTVEVDENADPLFDGISLLHMSDQISSPFIKESYSSSNSEEIDEKGYDQNKEVKTTTELYTDIFETLELELELFPSANEVLKGHQPTVFVNEEIADDKKLRL